MVVICRYSYEHHFLALNEDICWRRLDSNGQLFALRAARKSICTIVILKIEETVYLII